MPSLIAPSRPEYERVRHTYTATGAPAFVLRAADTEDVRHALAYAAREGLPLAVRSGGHGRSTNEGGLVLDLGALREVEVLDAPAGRVRVQAGARWGEAARVLDRHGLALTSGDYGDVGVGGLATVGGIGLLARRQGLTIDRVTAADVVLADGTLVRADEHQHPDLLWAVRGAGGAFGVVTAFEFRADPIAEVAIAELVYDGSDLAALFERWAAVVEGSPRDVTSFLYVQAGPQGVHARATVVDASGGRDAIDLFAGLAPVLDARVSIDRYMTLMQSTRAPHRGQAAGLTTRAGLLDHVASDHAAAIAALLTSGAAFLVQLRAVGGAVNDLPPDATAYAHRTQGFSLLAAAPRQSAQHLDTEWHAGIGHATRGTYLNLESERDDAILRRAFPPATLERLLDVKRRYDPAGLFDHNFPLAPQRRRTTHEALAA